MQRTSILLTVLLLLGAVPVADAQIAAPTGSTGGIFGRRRPVDPNAVTQEVTMTVDLAAAHDNVTPRPDDQELPSLVFAPQYGTLTSGTAALRYRVGTQLNFLEASGQGAASYATEGIERIRTAAGSLTGGLSSRERYGVTGTVAVSYEPAFLFDAFAPVASESNQGALADIVPAQGVSGQRWLTTDGTVSAYRGWTVQQRSEVRYSAIRREPIRPTMTVLNNSGSMMSVQHDWMPRRTLTVEMSYAYQENHQDVQIGAAQVLQTHRARTGVSISRRLSPSRSLTLRMIGGVARNRVEATEAFPGVEFTVPTVSGSARIDLTRSWYVAVDAARDVNVLQGLSPQPFTSNTVSARVGGNATSRVQLAASLAYSHGAGRRGSIDAGSFENIAGLAQAQVALTRQAALFVSYHYYDYQLMDIDVVQPEFPLRQGRNGIRAGVTFWLPIIGRF